MKPCALLLACLLSFPAFGQSAAVAPDNASVDAVVAAFSAAIIDKDKPRFLKLFLHDRIAWESVTGDANLREIRKQRPQAAKVSIDPGSNHLSFIDGIVADKEQQEEKFRNVRIETDGDIASVFFDYSYHDGDRETNHGRETWHLLRTDQGWKIVSVVWSMNWTPRPRAG